VQPEQLAVTVAVLVDRSVELAVKVTVEVPEVKSVVTEEELRIELPVAAKPIVAPLTAPLEESSARIVNVIVDVPSASSVKGLGAVSKILATEEVAEVVVVDDEGVLELPPPPPQEASTAPNSNTVIDLNIDIWCVLVVLYIFNLLHFCQPKPWV
jgi:hypothetical protein